MGLEADLALLFAPELTVPVLNGAVTARAYFDGPDAFVDDGTGEQVQLHEPSLGIAKGALGALTEHVTLLQVGQLGAASVVGGDPQYKVRDVRRLDDGLTQRVVLVPAGL